jgi:hypothetical protein
MKVLNTMIIVAVVLAANVVSADMARNAYVEQGDHTGRVDPFASGPGHCSRSCPVIAPREHGLAWTGILCPIRRPIKDEASDITAIESLGVVTTGQSSFSSPAAGVIVLTVRADTASEGNGLAEGDIILRVDGKTVNSGGELAQALESHTSDDDVSLTILHMGEELVLLVSLGKAA